MPDPVTRLRRTQTGADAYNEPTWNWVPADLPDALFAPGPSQEPGGIGRQPVITQPTLYWPHQWPDVASTDRLIVRGITYEVDGQPADWRGTAVGGLVVTLRVAQEKES